MIVLASMAIVHLHRSGTSSPLVITNRTTTHPMAKNRLLGAYSIKTARGNSSSSVKKYSMFKSTTRPQFPSLGKRVRSVRGSTAMVLRTIRMAQIIRAIISSTRHLQPMKKPKLSRPSSRLTPIRNTAHTLASRRRTRYSSSASLKPKNTLQTMQTARQMRRVMLSKNLFLFMDLNHMNIQTLEHVQMYNCH